MWNGTRKTVSYDTETDTFRPRKSRLYEDNEESSESAPDESGSTDETLDDTENIP